MNPDNLTQTAPERPANLAMGSSPQVATAPQQQYQYQPVATVSQPTAANTTRVLSEKATTYIKRISVMAIILGVLLVIVGILLGLFFDVYSFVNIPIGIMYLVYALKIRKPGVSAKQIILACRVIDMTVLTGLVVNIILGDFSGPGLLQIILFLFTTKLIIELYETGQITTKSPFTAKATI